jgi:hypothetical protein
MQSTSLYLDYRLDEIERDAAKVDFGLGRLAPRGG